MADVLTAAMKAVSGPVTAESLYNSLSNLTNVSTEGITAPYSTSVTPKAIDGYTRVFNPIVNWWKSDSRASRRCKCPSMPLPEQWLGWGSWRRPAFPTAGHEVLQ